MALMFTTPCFAKENNDTVTENQQLEKIDKTTTPSNIPKKSFDIEDSNAKKHQKNNQDENLNNQDNNNNQDLNNDAPDVNDRNLDNDRDNDQDLNNDNNNDEDRNNINNNDKDNNNRQNLDKFESSESNPRSNARERTIFADDTGNKFEQNNDLNKGQKEQNNDEYNYEYASKDDATDKPQSYQYHGHYTNFANTNHQKRYYYKGKYYNFNDYSNQYKNEGNTFTYEGPYVDHVGIFIFTDNYGNEFDLFLKPQKGTPRPGKTHELRIGEKYHFVLSPQRMYPPKAEKREGMTYVFSWGNMPLKENKYFDMFTAPVLFNFNGNLYVKH
jgi:hypothetical protein